MHKSSISVPVFATLLLGGGSGMANADSFLLSPDNPAELARTAGPAAAPSVSRPLVSPTDRMDAMADYMTV